MDTHPFGQRFLINHFVFKPSRYVEYEAGGVKSQGQTNLSIRVARVPSYNNEQSDVISVELDNNDIPSLIDSDFEFDACYSLNDRLLMFILPENTNVRQMTLSLLPSFGFSPTRSSKIFTPTEPVLGSIFTERMTPIKMSFTLCGPERLIELF